MSRIVVIGGRGAVGHVATTLLRQLGHEVTVAGRRADPHDPYYRQVDLFDAPALMDCCADADLVLNAAGPSSVIGGRVAQAALLSGKAYVDVAGDPLLWREIAQDAALTSPLSQSACVLGAGLTPGLSAMLPYYAAARLSHVARVNVYSGGIEALTHTSAEDFIVSLDPVREQGQPGCVLVDGAPVRGRTERQVSLPGVGRPFDALPYLSFELTRVAAELNIRHLAGYVLLADASLLMAGHESHAVEALVTASRAFAEQEGAQHYLVMDAEGIMAGQSARLRCAMHFDDSYRTTGGVAALTADHLLNAKASVTGLHWLPDVMDIETLLTRMTHHRIMTLSCDELIPGKTLEVMEGEV